MNKNVSLAKMMPIIQEVLDNGGEVKFTITGNSMLPMLRHKKDIVILKKPSGRLKRYDIPLFQRKNGKFILHRVVKVHRDSYSICGDNQVALERNVSDKMIIGVVIGFIKDGKYTSCNDKDYLRYVKKHCRTRIFRYYFTWLKKIRRKFYGS